ncbi:hypothetical protein [Chromobacterium amazonense]|uniref:hypothetical protein n=1 Tax=Chromobacterium amazonense TaxID=1382803 RepID=UPI003F7A2C89
MLAILAILAELGASDGGVGKGYGGTPSFGGIEMWRYRGTTKHAPAYPPILCGWFWTALDVKKTAKPYLARVFGLSWIALEVWVARQQSNLFYIVMFLFDFSCCGWIKGTQYGTRIGFAATLQVDGQPVLPSGDLSS